MLDYKEKIKIFCFILLIPSLIFANSNISESDFFYRVFNFIIFSFILYYFIANPIKNFFISREKDIEDSLNKNREQLLKARKDKNKAKFNLEKTKEDIITKLDNAKKKAEYIKKELLNKNSLYLIQLENQFSKNIKIEQNKIIQNTIYDLLDSNILLEDITLTNSQAVKILNNKSKDN